MPACEPGDVVLIRGVYRGNPGIPEESVVAVRSKTTEYETTVVTTDIVEVIGVPWWPPQTGDRVMDKHGGLWEFRHAEETGMLAFGITSPSRSPGDGTKWRGSTLLWRDGRAEV